MKKKKEKYPEMNVDLSSEVEPMNPLEMLEDLVDKGYCPSLHFDDNNYWAVSFEGTNPVTTKKFKKEVTFVTFIKPSAWCKTAEEAIRKAYKSAKIA